MLTWLTTISLIFGGCCSNAITLEQLTLQHPNAGSVLTFFQFLLISLHGLPKFLIWTSYGPRLRPRRVPITQYLIQVVLFYLVSLLNNAAFAYRIPMAVHIIFRSGGLIISMLIGWLVLNKRYTLTQTISVILVTIGVIITTLSASEPHSSSSSASPVNPYTYVSGIGILTLALVLSGFLGLVQDWTYSKYIRPSSSSPKQNGVVASIKEPESSPWQESMFYLHFLSLPMLLLLLPDLAVQMEQLNTIGPRAHFNFPLPIPASVNITSFPLSIIPSHALPHLPIHLFPQSGNFSLLSVSQSVAKTNPSTYHYPLSVSLSIPHIYLPLVLNTITQLVCVAGVHRLTTRVSALTVTLVLVVRKAVSLILSVVGITNVGLAIRGFAFVASAKFCSALGLDESMFNWSFWNVFPLDWDVVFSSFGTASSLGGPGRKKQLQEVDTRLMWTGAALVLFGTIGYAVGTQPREAKRKEKAKKD